MSWALPILVWTAYLSLFPGVVSRRILIPTLFGRPSGTTSTVSKELDMMITTIVRYQCTTSSLGRNDFNCITCIKSACHWTSGKSGARRHCKDVSGWVRVCWVPEVWWYCALDWNVQWNGAIEWLSEFHVSCFLPPMLIVVLKLLRQY